MSHQPNAYKKAMQGAMKSAEKAGKLGKGFGGESNPKVKAITKMKEKC